MENENLENDIDVQWDILQQTNQDLNSLQEEVLVSNDQSESISPSNYMNDLVSNIDSNPTFNEWQNFIQEIKETIKTDWPAAGIKKAWDMIFGFFKEKWERVIWFEKYDNFDVSKIENQDFDYLQKQIDEEISDPEKRTELTYLLSKIKDNKRIEQDPSLDEIGLFLKNVKPWQVLLTNWKAKSWEVYDIFNYATQKYSWSRWCHSIIISEITKNPPESLDDIKIIHSIWSWVEEVTLWSFAWWDHWYSSSDFLLSDIDGITDNEDKRNEFVDKARAKVWQEYDKFWMVLDLATWWKFDALPNKSYCSELVFDSLEETWLSLKKPHIAPSQLLLNEFIKPVYACNIDSF